MQQKIIFGLEGIQVNATQIVTSNEIFSLRELKTVKHGLIEPKHWFSCVCILMGLFLFNFGPAFILVGGFSIALGVIAFFSAKTMYTVIIETVHGEHQAFASECSDSVDQLIRAINTARINRVYF